MKTVYKHLSGHVVGALPNSNGPIRAKIKRCRSAYHKPFRKAEQLNLFFLGFGKFLGEERAICIVTSDLEAIKCASFNIFMKGATHWYKTQINNTLEADKIYFKLGSNLHVFREITKFPYILLYESCYLCSI